MGLGGFARTPTLKQNYFIFLEKFQKNQEQIINNQVKLTNPPPPPPPLINLNPPTRNPASTPGHLLIFSVKINISKKKIRNTLSVHQFGSRSGLSLIIQIRPTLPLMIQIRPTAMSSWIWIQTACKGYQQQT